MFDEPRQVLKNESDFIVRSTAEEFHDAIAGIVARRNVLSEAVTSYANAIKEELDELGFVGWAIGHGATDHMDVQPQTA